MLRHGTPLTGRRPCVGRCTLPGCPRWVTSSLSVRLQDRVSGQSDTGSPHKVTASQRGWGREGRGRWDKQPQCAAVTLPWAVRSKAGWGGGARLGAGAGLSEEAAPGCRWTRLRGRSGECAGPERHRGCEWGQRDGRQCREQTGSLGSERVQCGIWVYSDHVQKLQPGRL